MSWDGMFKKFGRKTKVANTYPVHGAGGDVVGISSDADRRLADENEAVHAENKRLTVEIDRLIGQLKNANRYRDQLREEVVRLQETAEKYQRDNAELRQQVLKGWQHEYGRGYETALINVIQVIGERDGRAGKKQILTEVERLLRVHKEEHGG